jgi:hypothetical protein
MGIEAALRLSEDSEVEIAACPSCQTVLPRRWRRGIWIEVPVGGGWVAAYRLVIKADRAVLAEARLFPRERDPRREAHRPAGRWSERGALVPPAGMPGTILKELRLVDPIAVLPRATQNWEASHGRPVANRVLRRFAMSTTTPLARRITRPRRRPDELIVGFAVAYAKKVEDGHAHPIKELAGERSYSPHTVREIIHEARERGFLTAPTERGKAGGRLTAKAKDRDGPRASRRASPSGIR